MEETSRRRRAGARWATLAGLGAGLVLGAAGCATTSPHPSRGVVQAVGAENEYADVIAQIGGRYVHATSILDNPNTDPHSFEASPSVAREVGSAQLVVQNGLGYDAFMPKIESATRSAGRTVIVVQHVLGLPDSTANPHLWYEPATMPKVAAAVADALSAVQPAHAGYFRADLRAFDASLTPWLDAIAAFKMRFAGTAVATTEPVADFLLQAMGLANLTPRRLQADIMNGTDPSPEDITFERALLTEHRVKALCYNAQVNSSLTTSIRQSAESAGIPVVGVYETMPTGYRYQRWMRTETIDIAGAVAGRVSTPRL